MADCAVAIVAMPDSARHAVMTKAGRIFLIMAKRSLRQNNAEHGRKHWFAWVGPQRQSRSGKQQFLGDADTAVAGRGHQVDVMRRADWHHADRFADDVERLGVTQVLCRDLSTRLG